MMRSAVSSDVNRSEAGPVTADEHFQDSECKYLSPVSLGCVAYKIFQGLVVFVIEIEFFDKAIYWTNTEYRIKIVNNLQRSHPEIMYINKKLELCFIKGYGLIKLHQSTYIIISGKSLSYVGPHFKYFDET